MARHKNIYKFDKKNPGRLLSLLYSLTSTKALMVIVVLAITGCVGMVSKITATTPTNVVEAEDFTFPAILQTAVAPSGTNEAHLKWATSGTKKVDFTDNAVLMTVSARSDSCYGAPILEVQSDGQIIMSQEVTDAGYKDYTVPVNLAKGFHTLQIAFKNDKYVAPSSAGPGCDRNVYIDKLIFTGQSFSESVQTADQVVTTIDAKSLNYAGYGMVTGDGGMVWSNGQATGNFILPEDTTSLVARVYGAPCEGAPNMKLMIDGSLVQEALIPNTSVKQYASDTKVSKGPHSISVEFTNDHMALGGCDRNLHLVSFEFRNAGTQKTTTSVQKDTPQTTATETPVATPAKTSSSVGQQLYVNPNTEPYRMIYGADFATWRKQQSAQTLSNIKKIADQPMPLWLGGYPNDQQRLTSILSDASAKGQAPILVLYNIPNRDNGQYSASGGGAKDLATYKAWIDGITLAIGSKQAIIILEPDAIGQGIDGLYRKDALSYATSELGKLPNTKAYIDAAHSGWYGTSASGISTMAGRLKSVGISNISGFSLNVSNFNTNANEISYGNKLSAQVGGKPFVIDTSRNGNGPRPAPITHQDRLEFNSQAHPGEYYWCNPPGRALGQNPSFNTGTANVDAFLWIKLPGEIDGPCRGATKDVGLFWIAYGLELARNVQ
jgi:endoglucanase